AAVAPGGAGNQDITFTYTKDGSPRNLRLPAEPGDYELIYVQNVGHKRVLTRKPITLTAVTARIEAPDEAAAGDTIRVTWEGPDYNHDYIAAVAPGGAGNQDITFTYTKVGSP